MKEILLGLSGLLVIPTFVYGVYSLAVLFHKDKERHFSLSRFPKITVFFPALNEEKVIDMKIRNLTELDYPKELFEVIVVDDASTDNTSQACYDAFKKYAIKGLVLKNKVRKGVNYNYNLAIKTSKTEIILTTDADVIFEKNAIKEGLKVLLSSEKIGAVCGELKPVITKKSIATSTEAPYRNVYGKMCSWESSLESSYCFNGPLILLKKKTFSPINPSRGASDASCALKILSNGFQTKYVSSMKFSELIATSLKEQKRQKIRRATRLLQCTWDAKNLLFKGIFGWIVFPLRYLMFFVSPLAFFIGSFSLIVYLFLESTMFGAIASLIFMGLFLFGQLKENFLSSFVWHQYYLLMGVLNMFKPNYTWKPIERKVLK
jgi:cellulose synthase/poly-beta-1,6-N-acetylglucosamine synthase-like glycosyltransferase